MAGIKIKIHEGTGTRDLYVMVATDDGLGTTKKKVGTETYSFELVVDTDWFHSMGARAARNANGRAVRGGVTAKVVNRRRL